MFIQIIYFIERSSPEALVVSNVPGKTKLLSNGCFQGQIFLRKLLIGANPTETFFNVCLFLFTFMACYC